MAQRRLPFGYKMELGKVIPHEAEAAIVQNIFQQYALGLSYGDLVTLLDKQPIFYEPRKPWNKNMIARMLANKRYLGENGLPPLISTDLFITVAERRAEKTNFTPLNELQKTIRRLARRSLTSRMETQVLQLLNSLSTKPSLIQVPPIPSPPAQRLSELQLQLENTLAQDPIDEECAKHLITEIAAEQYKQLSPVEYETERLTCIFSTLSPMTELDPKLLKATVSSISVRKNSVSLQLKNGQTIESGELT